MSTTKWKLPSSTGNKTFKRDGEHLFRIKTEKGKKTSLTVRFLPPSDNEPEDITPVVEVRRYIFNSAPFTKKDLWYIERSRATIGDRDPVMEYNAWLWSQGVKGRSIVSSTEKNAATRAKKSFIVNAQIVDYSMDPSLNGSVVQLELGPELYRKSIEKGALGENPDERSDVFEDGPQDPFDLEAGWVFQIKKRHDGGKDTYNGSDWLPNPVKMTPNEIKEVMNKLNSDPNLSLYQWIDPKNFKSYEELEERLKYVMRIPNLKSFPNTLREPSFDSGEYNSTFDDDDDEGISVMPPAESKSKSPFSSNGDDDDDEDEDYFGDDDVD